MAHIIVPGGSYEIAHFLNEPFQLVRVFLFQFRILGFREENIFISAKRGGRLLTRSRKFAGKNDRFLL